MFCHHSIPDFVFEQKHLFHEEILVPSSMLDDSWSPEYNLMVYHGTCSQSSSQNASVGRTYYYSIELNLTLLSHFSFMVCKPPDF